MNKKSQYIQESIIRDILDTMESLSDIDDMELDTLVKQDRYMSSLVSKSKDLVMTFPVMFSSNLSIRSVSMLTKALERKMVVILQLILSSYNVTNTKTTEEFIKRLHRNIDDPDILNLLDDILSIGESAKIKINITPMEAGKLHADTKTIINTGVVLENSIEDSSLNSYYVENVRGKKIISNNSLRNNRRKLNEDTGPDLDPQYFKNQLLSSDIKKANELAPTLMVVNIVIDLGADQPPISKNIIIGVKARAMMVSSDDIVNRVFTKVDDSNFLLKLIRATTKEISFTRDLIFGIDKAKIDVLSRSRHGKSNSMWRLLEKRAMQSKMSRSLNIRNSATAITTLVVSSEEVEYLNKKYGIDLHREGTAIKLMDSLNLMCLTIVDESLEATKWLFDGSDSYEILSFSSMIKENESDELYKKVITLISNAR